MTCQCLLGGRGARTPGTEAGTFVSDRDGASRREIPVIRESTCKWLYNRVVVGETFDHNLFAGSALKRRHDFAQFLFSILAKFPSSFREQDGVNHRYLNPILELLDLHLVSVHLGLEILVELPVGVVHLGSMLNLLDFLVVLLLRHTPGNNPEHQSKITFWCS